MTEGQKFDCFYCSNSYESEEHMKFHLLECESRQNILEEFKNLFNSCTNCGTKFTRYDHLQRHVTTCQSRKETKMFQCYHCQKTFANKPKLYRHQKCHRNTVWKFQNFLSFRFSVKPILEGLKVLKKPFLPFLGLRLLLICLISGFKKCKNAWKSWTWFRASKCVKMEDFALLEFPNLI